jgi:hypothetical protein
MMQSQCIILHESVMQDEIDSTQREKWLQIFDILDVDPEAGLPQQIIFRTLDGQTQVRYINDLQSGYPFLVVEGESISEVLRKIYSLFPTYSRDDIFRIIRNPANAEEYGKGILYLGLLGLGQKCDHEILELFRELLQDKDPKVRSTAFYGLCYPAWPESLELIQQLAKNDTDAGVRQMAADLLEKLEYSPSARN